MKIKYQLYCLHCGYVTTSMLGFPAILVAKDAHDYQEDNCNLQFRELERI